MLRGVLAFLILTMGVSVAQAWKLELHGADDGPASVEHSAGQWKLTSPGRRDQWVPRPCGQAIWDQFEDELKTKIAKTPLRFPARENIPTGVAALKVKWKDQEFFIAQDSDTGRWLRSLPDELGVKRAEEQIYCRRGIK